MISDCCHIFDDVVTGCLAQKDIPRNSILCFCCIRPGQARMIDSTIFTNYHLSMIVNGSCHHWNRLQFYFNFCVTRVPSLTDAESGWYEIDHEYGCIWG
jgi:hypothetical protein